MKHLILLFSFLLVAGLAQAQTDIQPVWLRHDNVAEYQGAGWNNVVKRASNITLDEAFLIANTDPNISYFFITKNYMNLGNRGNFSPGDVVFFSGKPWLGSAPGMADVFEKDQGKLISSGAPLAESCISLDDDKLEVICPTLRRVEIMTNKGVIILNTYAQQTEQFMLDLNYLKRGRYMVRIENIYGQVQILNLRI